MKITAFFALTFVTSLALVFGQKSDEASAILEAERELAIAYLKSDADGIAQGVMEDYTLTNSTGKITTPELTILARPGKTIRNTKSSRITT
jgi:hypothetical protein